MVSQIICVILKKNWLHLIRISLLSALTVTTAFATTEQYCSLRLQQQLLFEENVSESFETCLKSQRICAREILPKLQFLKTAEDSKKDLNDLTAAEVQQLLIIRRCAEYGNTELGGINYCKMQSCLESFLPNEILAKQTLDSILATLTKITQEDFRNSKQQLQRLRIWADQQKKNVRVNNQKTLAELKAQHRKALHSLKQEQELVISDFRQSTLIKNSKIRDLQAQQRTEFKKLEIEFKSIEDERDNELKQQLAAAQRLLTRRKDLLTKLENKLNK